MSKRTRLGGNLSQYQREQLGIYKKLDQLPKIDMGWRWQCYCGSTHYVKYRAWFYCQTCARRVTNPDINTDNPTKTFRKEFNEQLSRLIQ